MHTSHFASSRPRFLLTLLASAALATTGCSNSMVSSGSIGSGSADTKIGGKIHGGNQPVSGATVNLYFALQTGFAGGAQLAASTLSSSDGNGSFSFSKTSTSANNGSNNTFTCLTGQSNNPFVFVVAKGGTTVNTTGATPNTDAEFIAPLGRCNDISSSTNVYMSEVVTVATMAAIHQYMNPTNATSPATPIESTIGSDGTFVSNQALTNAFTGVQNMVDLTTGLGLPSITRPGVGVTMTITPELAKLNQLANIISSCINQASSGSANCQSLYAAATPPASATGTSVPGATEHTATDLLTALYNIFSNPTNGGTANLTTLYNLAPASGAPYQPTLSAVPTDWTLGIAYAASGNCNTSSQPFINNPTEITTDISGNMFLTNSAANGSQVIFNSLGFPIACQSVPGASGIVYDANGNTWTGSSTANTITRYGALLASQTVFTTPAPVQSITADGYGDVFFSTTGGDLYEIVNGATVGSATIPVKINTITLGTGSKILIDTTNTIWAASGSTYITATTGTPFPAINPTTLSFLGATTTQLPVGAPSSWVAPTSNTHSGVYSSSRSSTAIQAQGGTVTPLNITSGGGMNTPAAIALDGAQNVWVANGVGSSVSGFDITGAAITPSTGYVKPSGFLAGQNAILVDPSGNIWVGLTGSNIATEIVGAAVPVFQPYSNGLDPTTPRYGQIP